MNSTRRTLLQTTALGAMAAVATASARARSGSSPTNVDRNPAVRYRRVRVGDLNIFYREAGP
ncbi:MAG TPA: hypothetical protein VIM73_11705, partial [Polyangiaceae bacterium]